MQKRDSFFIFISIVLIILFASEIFSNVSRERLDKPLEKTIAPQVDTGKIVKALEAVGLEPREAKYYKVIE